ncbi:MAG: putative epoxide hydrolase [Subtercola sp.]|nr:putative epoxide hydrolase [Subtercola sp.]
MQIEPFTVAVSDDSLADLNRRLEQTRWPDELHDVGWDYGTPNGYLRELVEYWRDSFDWRAAERRLNSFAQKMATIDGQRVHFIHEKGIGPAPLPIILSHGWPGTFNEFSKIIPLLTDPAAHGSDAADAFDVVVPSLPGFAFSDPFLTSGDNHRRMADLFDALMTDGLGYARFAAHGGDIGGVVTASLGDRHADQLRAMHVTSTALVEPQLSPETVLSAAERAFLEGRNVWREAEGAYAHQQNTKPQTLSHGLTDSPVGLASWIVEKYRAWSDCGGDVESRFSKDELLTTISLYWHTNSIASANRIYRDNSRDRLMVPDARPIPVRTGMAVFAGDINQAPEEWAARLFALERYVRIPRGGHFAAFEEPQLLADELRTFFRAFR